jgi:hypothetical protein
MSMLLTVALFTTIYIVIALGFEMGMKYRVQRATYVLRDAPPIYYVTKLQNSPRRAAHRAACVCSRWSI